MGNRLSKIYTRTGDDGTTGLGNGDRIDKDSARVSAYGTVDELNSHLGHLLALDIPTTCRTTLLRIQHHLFDIGGELCIPGHSVITHKHVSWLEQQLDELNENLPYLKEFILPGGNQACGVCHVARAVCRRAEREVITLNRNEDVNAQTINYLNRLSDLLFVVCREILRADGKCEIYWDKSLSNSPLKK